MEGIYLVWPREFYTQKMEVFKVGRTSKGIFQRFKGYPKGSQLLLWNACGGDLNENERIVMNMLTEKFQRKEEYGKEYFAGPVDEMIFAINSCINTCNSWKNQKSSVGLIHSGELPRDEPVSSKNLMSAEEKVPLPKTPTLEAGKEISVSKYTRTEFKLFLRDIFLYKGWTFLLEASDACTASMISFRKNLSSFLDINHSEKIGLRKSTDELMDYFLQLPPDRWDCFCDSMGISLITYLLMKIPSPSKYDSAGDLIENWRDSRTDATIDLPLNQSMVEPKAPFYWRKCFQCIYSVLKYSKPATKQMYDEIFSFTKERRIKKEDRLLMEENFLIGLCGLTEDQVDGSLQIIKSYIGDFSLEEMPDSHWEDCCVIFLMMYFQKENLYNFKQICERFNLPFDAKTARYKTISLVMEKSLKKEIAYDDMLWIQDLYLEKL